MRQKAAPLSLLKIAASMVNILFFVGTVVAGALLGIDRPIPSVVLRLHQVLPVPTHSRSPELCLLLRSG
jgi:hypothetical protein